MKEKKHKKYFRDVYPGHEERSEKGDFIGLIPFLGRLIKKIFAVIFSVLKFLKLPITIIIGILVVKYAIDYVPKAVKEIDRTVQEVKWDESPEELKGKDYLIATEWGVCYQQIKPTKERKVCLSTNVGFLEYGLAWKGYFERDKKGNVNILLRAYEGSLGEFVGAKHRVLFYHNPQANNRRVMEASRNIDPFSCKKGVWRFAPGSEHRKDTPYLKVNPKIIFYGKDCPRLYITFFKI